MCQLQMHGVRLMFVQEISLAGRPYLLDRAGGLVYRDVASHVAPELVGKWVQVRLPSHPAAPRWRLPSFLSSCHSTAGLHFAGSM